MRKIILFEGDHDKQRFYYQDELSATPPLPITMPLIDPCVWRYPSDEGLASMGYLPDIAERADGTRVHNTTPDGSLIYKYDRTRDEVLGPEVEPEPEPVDVDCEYHYV